MYLKSFFNDLNITNDDRFYLCILLAFSLLITFVMISFHQTRGALNSDIYVYLAGALDVANMNYNHISSPIWIQNSPVIIFLTSLLFRLGLVDINAMFIVTGCFGILGIFGMYTFLKIRFSPLISLTGAILYNSLSLTLFYYANAMLDTSAVAMIIWTLIFTVAAVNKNSKYFILVSLSFVLTFFTRFTTAFIISLIILYILKDHDIINLFESLFYNKSIFKKKIISFFKSHEFKWILISALLGIAFFAIICVWLLQYGQLSYFSMAQGSIGRYTNPTDPQFITSRYFFLKNFLNLLSANSISFNPIEQFNEPSILSYLIVVIGSIGILLKILSIFKNRKIIKANYKTLEFRNKYSRVILGIFCVFLIIIGVIGFKVNYLITLVCFWIMFLIVMSLVREYPVNMDNSTLYIMCFGLFAFYFVIVSYIDLKCVRYILPAFPGFVYMVIYSLNYIVEFINNGFQYETLHLNLTSSNKKFAHDAKWFISRAIPVVLIIICLFFAFNFTNTVDHNEDDLDRVELCDFIKEYDPDYQSKEFLCMWDLRYFEWYLNKDIIKYREDVNEIDPDRYDYVITFNKTFDYDNYRLVHHEGNYYLNEKISY